MEGLAEDRGALDAKEAAKATAHERVDISGSTLPPCSTW